MTEKHWNRCDECGKFIPYDNFKRGATRRLLTPDSEYSSEEYETLCKRCVKEVQEP